MAVTNRDRGARYRAKKAAASGMDLTPGQEPFVSAGERLTLSLRAERKLTAAEDRLAVEAGRLADRLDDMHAYLSGRRYAWLSGVIERAGECGHTIVIEVDRVLSEIRQQELAFARVLGELRQHGASAAKASAREPAAAPTALPGAGTDTPDVGDDGEFGDLFAVG